MMRGIKFPLSIVLKGHSKTACLSQNFPVTNITSDRKMLCTGNPSPLLLTLLVLAEATVTTGNKNYIAQEGS